MIRSPQPFIIYIVIYTSSSVIVVHKHSTTTNTVAFPATMRTAINLNRAIGASDRLEVAVATVA